MAMRLQRTWNLSRKRLRTTTKPEIRLAGRFTVIPSQSHIVTIGISHTVNYTVHSLCVCENLKMTQLPVMTPVNASNIN